MAAASEKIDFSSKQKPILRDASSLKQGSISDDDREVFKANVDGVEYRTVTWQRAIVIFIKTQIATGVLGIPSALYNLSAVGGGICVVAFQALNLCSFLYRLRPEISTDRKYRYNDHCREFQEQSSGMPHHRRYGWCGMGPHRSRVRRVHLRYCIHLLHQQLYPRYIHRSQRSFQSRSLLCGFYLRRYCVDHHVLLYPDMA